MSTQTNLQIKKFPKLYNFKGEYICELSEALNVNESLRFGGLNTLEFQYPIYQIDAHNNVIRDIKNNPVINPKYDFIENDIRVLFDNKWYVIKIDEDERDATNKLLVSVTCYSIEFTLQEIMVEYLDLTPPLNLPVNATTALQQVLESAQQVRDNFVVGTSGMSIVLDTNAHPTTSIYNGYKIKILKGTGVGQERTINSYNGTTKTAVVSSAFSPQPDTTSVYRIYNDVWKVGTIDSVFNTDLRSHKFDFVNGLEALQQVRDKYLDNADEVGYLTYSSSYNYSTNRWENYVNLVQATPYSTKQIDFRYKKNIQSVNRRKETGELFTRIIPTGVDNLTVGVIPSSNRTDYSVTYPEHLFGYNYIDNFQYFLGQGYTYKECADNFVKTFRFNDSRYTTSQSLFDDCKKMLQKMSVPKFTYLTTILDLSVLTGREYEEFELGDTVKIYDEELGIDIYAVISAINRSQENPQNATIEITNYVDNMGDFVKRIVNRGDGYSNIKSQYGNTATYIVADKKSSLNWRKADVVVGEFEYANEVIQKLINSIDSAKGAKIILMEGVYYFNGAISLKSNVYIEGQGSGTKLIGIGSRSVSFAISTNGTAPSRLSNLGVSKMNINNFANGVGHSYCDNIKMNDLLIQNVENNYIIAQSSSNLYIYDNIIATPVYATGVGQDGIDIKSCNIVNISRNTIYTCLYRGINIQETIGDVNIIDNVVESNYTDFIGSFLSPIYIYNTNTPPLNWQDAVVNYRINVQGNTVLDTTTNNTDAKIATIMVQAYRNVKIINNTLIGGVNCIYLAQSLDADVASNTLRYYKLQGIFVVGTASYYCGRHKIQLNDLQSLNASNGIYIGADVQDCVTTNNYLKNSCANPALKYADFGLNNTQTAGNRY